MRAACRTCLKPIVDNGKRGPKRKFCANKCKNKWNNEYSQNAIARFNERAKLKAAINSRKALK